MSRAAGKKLVLAVIDSLKPEMLDRAIAEGRAPALQTLVERGVYIDDCVSVFPSVTPVASATITTGTTPDSHHIPAMNWFLRGEERYVEYGSSFPATRTFGVVRSLFDTVYNMNLAHLSRATPTIFERLDDAGVRTACTTYLIYRGRHRHPAASASVLSRLGKAMQFRHAVYGPAELFYADIFESRATGCTSTLGLPGQRDQHSGCVGAHLVENDLFDFMLLSLPDNDTHSHKYGPEAQVTSLAAADQQIERMMHAAGGPDEFLDDHAVIVCSDHSQSEIEDEIDLFRAFDGLGVLPPSGVRESKTGRAEIAVCPSSRSAQVYVLDHDARPSMVPRVVRTLLALDGVDLVMRLTDHPDGEVSVQSRTGELRFTPRGDLTDLRGETWSVDGDLSVLALDVRDGTVRSARYPDALGRVWAALRCRRTGEVHASARPGWEFLDWGRAHHIGGGSHGSLHAVDSLGSLLWCGTGPDDSAVHEQWTLRDVLPMILDHFGVAD